MNMKLVEAQTTVTRNSLTTFCTDCARKLAAEIKRTKQELAAQFRKSFTGNERMLRLVLNEAEALAFLTEYPQLVFPSLALEKVEGAVAWQKHQQEVLIGQFHPV
jgi:hypothetical protein